LHNHLWFEEECVVGLRNSRNWCGNDLWLFQ